MKNKIDIKQIKNGFELPVLGLGTWQIGGKRERDESHDEQDIAAIKLAIDSGITHIDTAESYAAGHTEELVGKAISDLNRLDLIITSKVSYKNLSADNVRKSLEASLKRLKTDYLDLYLIHSPNDDIQLEETLGEFDRVVDEGLVHWIGASNFSKERLKRAQEIAQHPIVINQVYYNVRSRGAETTGLLKYCQENDVILEAFRPIDKGVLLKNPPAIVRELAKKYSKTFAQIIINWLISQKNVTALVKTTNSAHLKENLGATGWAMDKEDIERLRLEYSGKEDKSDDFKLR